MPTDDRIGFKLELTLCDRTIEAEVPIPNQSMRVADLLPVLLSFDNAVVGMAADKSESEGLKISCREGCGACCRQLVPISDAEAVYLAELVAALPPERQARVRERFREALAALGESLVERLRDTSEFKDLAQRRELGEEYFRRGVACPFLEEERCTIYPHRPMTCREYLVTSPAENCQKPSPETVRPVPIPIKLSQILYQFGDGVGNQPTRWIPLVLALEFTGEQRCFPAPEMFKNFVSRIRG
ncbi:MAG: YkgJ family cysteine cluster protein [Bryobacteraceae bacterium]|jgi:Fe-S-cluster containining protein